MLNAVDGQETKVIMHDNPQACFEAAIRKGLLSADSKQPNFAGHYMYMCHDRFNRAYFKHRTTRETLPATQLDV